MNAIHLETDIDALRERLVEVVLKQSAQIDPELAEATINCSILNWFDLQMVKKMQPPEKPFSKTPEELIDHISALPFSELHPSRPETWRFKEDFRILLVENEAVRADWQGLHQRAANLFKGLLDEKNLVGEPRFADPDWKDFAAEWIYHLLQLDPEEAIRKTRKICAEALGVLTYGEQPEVVFCSDFLSKLHWSDMPERAKEDIAFLQNGINALIDYQGPKALTLLYELSAIPELTPDEKGGLLDWTGQIHLYDEWLIDRALQQFRKAEQAMPEHAFVQEHIAEVYFYPGILSGRIDLARQYAERAGELAPEKSYSLVLLGDLAKLQEDWQAAIDFYRQASQAEPDLYTSYLRLSEVYSAKGDVGDAFAMIDKALEVSPYIKYFAIIRKGKVYYDAGRYKDSLEYYQQAIEDSPDRPDAYIRMGESCAALWKIAEAEQAYQKAIELDPESEDAHLSLIDLYQQQDKLDAAIKKCQQAIDCCLTQKGILIALRNLYRDQLNLKDMKQAHEQLVALDPAEAYASHCEIGKVWLEKALQSWDAPEKEHWLSEAQSEFEQAKAIDPNLAWAYICLAELAILRSDEKTVDQQRELLAEKATWAKYDMLVDLGKTYIKNLQYEQSRKLLEAAIDVLPRRMGAWRALSEWYDQHGDAQRVVQVWEKMIELNPTYTYEAHMYAGYAYEKAVDNEKARSEYLSAIEENPNRSDARQALANLLMEAGELDEAVQAFRNLASAHPGLAATAQLGIMQAYMLQGRFDDAEQALRAAIQLEPDSPAGYLQLAYLGALLRDEAMIEEGRSKLKSGSPDRLYDLYLIAGDGYQNIDQVQKAERYFKKGLKLHPERPEAYTRLGLLAVQQEDFSKAKRWLNKALKADGRYLVTYQVLSQLSRIKGDLQGVIEAENEIIRLDPAERYNSNRLIGGMYENSGQIEEAERWYRAAVELAPWRADAYIDLGSLLLKADQDKEAQKIYQQAMAYANVDYLALGQYYERQNKNKDAAAVYRLGIDYAPYDQKAGFYFALADLYHDQEDFESAETAYRRLIEAAPEHAYDAYGLLGDLYDELEEIEQAEQAYRQAIKLDPERADGYLALAGMLEDRNLPAAIRVLRQMALKPALAYDAYYSLGNLYADREDGERAERAYRRAIKLNPELEDGYVSLAQMLVNLDRRAEAIKVVRQMARQPGLAYNAAISLGNLYADQGADERAERAYRRALELEPEQVHAYLSLAGWYQAQGDWSQAETVLRQAVEKAQENPEVYQQLAELREQRRDWEEAVELYRRVVELQPVGELAPVAHEKIGNILLEQRYYDQAERELQKAIELAPKYGLAYRDLARLYGEQQDHKGVAQLSQQLLSLTLTPEEKYDAHMIIADAYDRVGDYLAAIRAYQNAIELYPDRTDPYLELGNLHAGLGQYQMAELAYRQAIEINPEQAYDAHGYLGSLYADQAKDEQAERAYRQAIELDPERLEGYIALAQMLADRKQWQKAIQVVQQMAQQPDLAYQAYLSLGGLYASQGDEQQAEHAYRQAIELEPELVDGYVELAQMLVELDKRPEAIQVVQQMAWQPGLAYSAAISLGNLYADQGDGEQAERAYRQAIKLKPEQVEAYLSLAAWYQAHNDPSQAETVLRQAVEKAHKDPEVYHQLAELREQQGDWEEALELYRWVVDLQPGGDLAPVAHEKIGSILLEQKQYDQSERELHKAIELAPKYGLAYQDLARLYGEQQDLKGVVQLSQQLLSLDLSQEEEYEAHLIIADAYDRAELYAPAVSELKKAIKLQPKRWEAHFQLGGIYEIQARWEQARKEYKKVGKLNPEFEPDVRQRIGQLWMLEGELMLLEGSLEQAEKNFRKAISLSPDLSNAYFDLGQLYTDSNRSDQAIEIYRQAIELDLDSATSALLNIGSIYRSSGKLEEMRQVCAEVVSRVTSAEDPDSNNIRRLGLAHLMCEDYSEANQALMQALEKDNTNAIARLYLAVSLTASGEYAEAKQQLAKGIQQAKLRDDFIYPIEEASVLAERLPGNKEAQDLLEALGTAREEK